MKSYISIILMGFAVSTSAQGLLYRIHQTAKAAAESTILNKTSETVSQKTDEVLTRKRKDKKADSESADHTNDNQVILTPYSKFDFVPGQEIVYYRNFAGENSGELPYGWNTSGSGAVIEFGDFEGKWLQLHQSSVFLTDNPESFSENFTLEFDLLLNDFGNGIINYPAFFFGFLSSGSGSTTDNSLLGNPDRDFSLIVNASVINDGNGNSSFQLHSSEAQTMYFQTGQKAFPHFDDMIGEPVHVAIQVQKERFRMWLNSEKLFDVPKAVSLKFPINQLYFEVSDNGYSNDQVGIFITNLKVAKGIPDMRHQLIDEGKFSTNGILFDVNSADIRPQSYAVVKEIADLLKKYPKVRIQIIGHTDSDGTDNDNQKLSAQRASSVKEMLANEFGIAESRMNTLGKGESEPIADNKSPNGKAKNRRVEFIKIN